MLQSSWSRPHVASHIDFRNPHYIQREALSREKWWCLASVNRPWTLFAAVKRIEKFSADPHPTDDSIGATRMHLMTSASTETPDVWPSIQPRWGTRTLPSPPGPSSGVHYRSLDVNITSNSMPRFRARVWDTKISKSLNRFELSDGFAKLKRFSQFCVPTFYSDL